MDIDIVFLALAQNCAATLPKFFEMLSDLKRAGMHCIAYIGENHSRDGTTVLLREAAQRNDVVHISTDFMADEPNRLRRMALGRQHLKNKLSASDLDPKLICIADVDTVMRQPPTLSAIRGAIVQLARPDIFAVSATSWPTYYDILAYEDDRFSFDFLAEDFKRHQTNIFSYYRFFVKNVYPFRRILTTERELLCTSAFNGMAIYKADAYALGSYVDSDFRTCEHVIFNRKIAMITQQKLLVDPGLLLLTPDDHSEENFINFTLRRVKKLLMRSRI